jgi:hypothetical protein
MGDPTYKLREHVDRVTVIDGNVVAIPAPKQKSPFDDLGATVEVGMTTLGKAGTDVAVTNVGTPKNAVLAFTIPKASVWHDGHGPPPDPYLNPLPDALPGDYYLDLDSGGIWKLT